MSKLSGEADLRSLLDKYGFTCNDSVLCPLCGFDSLSYDELYYDPETFVGVIFSAYCDKCFEKNGYKVAPYANGEIRLKAIRR